MLKQIIKRLVRQCAVCGGQINAKVHKDRTYRGGHYFFTTPLKIRGVGGVIGIKNAEYWECPKCFW